MATADDKKMMSLALELATKGRGTTTPNPMVGAVLVKSGRVIGSGYHKRAGSAHAEVVAIRKAGKNAKRATLYVTLEPCHHVGRTGPCTEQIIKAGIKRVHYAVSDPDPRVAGKGAKALRRAGINVSRGLLRAEATALNEIHFGYHKLGRPYIIAKVAQTLDGNIATIRNDSQWITNDISRKYAHRLRAMVDGVVIGAHTLRVDNPLLTVRNVQGPNPYRLVVTAGAQLPISSHLISENTDLRTIIVTTVTGARRLKKRKSPHNIIIWELPEAEGGHIDIASIVDQANRFGIKSLLVEGGQTLTTAFVKAKLIDKWVAMIAPKLIGAGLSQLGDLKTKRIDHGIAFSNSTYEQLGSDIMFSGYPVWGDR